MTASERPIQIIPSVLPADWAAMGQCVITLGTPDWDLLDSLRWNLNNSRGTVDGTWDTSIVSA